MQRHPGRVSNHAHSPKTPPHLTPTASTAPKQSIGGYWRLQSFHVLDAVWTDPIYPNKTRGFRTVLTVKGPLLP